MPRTTAKYGRDGTRLGSRRRSLVLPRGDVEHRLFGSLATSSRLLTSTTEQRLHSKRLEALSDVPSSSDRLDSVNTEVDCSVRSQMSNCTVRWRTILHDRTRAQKTICTETDCVRRIFARTQLFGRVGDHVTFLCPEHCVRDR